MQNPIKVLILGLITSFFTSANAQKYDGVDTIQSSDEIWDNEPSFVREDQDLPADLDNPEMKAMLPSRGSIPIEVKNPWVRSWKDEIEEDLRNKALEEGLKERAQKEREAQEKEQQAALAKKHAEEAAALAKKQAQEAAAESQRMAKKIWQIRQALEAHRPAPKENEPLRTVPYKGPRMSQPRMAE